MHTGVLGPGEDIAFGMTVTVHAHGLSRRFDSQNLQRRLIRIVLAAFNTTALSSGTTPVPLPLLFSFAWPP